MWWHHHPWCMNTCSGNTQANKLFCIETTHLQVTLTPVVQGVAALHQHSGSLVRMCSSPLCLAHLICSIFVQGHWSGVVSATMFALSLLVIMYFSNHGVQRVEGGAHHVVKQFVVRAQHTTCQENCVFLALGLCCCPRRACACSGEETLSLRKSRSNCNYTVLTMQASCIHVHMACSKMKDGMMRGSI